MNKERVASTNLSHYRIVAKIGASVTMLRSLFLLTSFLWIAIVAAQAQTVVTLTADQLHNGQAVELDKLGWKYSPGDDPRFADPNFADAAWEPLKTSAMTKDSLPQAGWNGIGWFRLRLKAAPALAGISLNLETAQLGASEIYLDGKLIKRFGIVGNTYATEVPYNPNAEPLGIAFDGTGEHLIAVRYSNQAAADINSGYGKWLLGKGTIRVGAGGIGFAAQIKNFDDTANQSWNVGFGFAYTMVQATVCFSFFILHILLFALYPHQRGNLYYSLYCLSVTLNNVFFIGIATYHSGTVVYYWCYLLFYSTWVLAQMALLAFLYTDFERRLPRYFWIFPAVAAFYLFQLAFFHDTVSVWLYNVFNIAVGIEITRIMIRAIRRRMPDAWIVGIGIFLFDIALLRELVLGLTIVELPTSIYLLTDILGFYGLLLLITIYLARQFARTSTNLDAQLVKEVEYERAANQLALEREQEKARFALVKAENERRAAELEEARQLQLSMLPKKLPNLPHLDIAAYMKTASEVGGDYYDFHTSEDGTLTIAVGDATGHGLKAGTMVSVVKGLFVSLAYHPDIPHIFHRISAVLKEMKLRGLFMAMTMVKVRGNQMTLSIAGMPSVLIYRAMTGEVEEVVMRALPLGGMTKYQYQQRELTLAAEDVVVLMSDGLPERFNVRDEMLDYERIHQALPALAHQSAEQIIAELTRLGDEWSEGRAQDDDVTFVVLKIKSSVQYGEQ